MVLESKTPGSVGCKKFRKARFAATYLIHEKEK
jgi:hypothetical protein